MLVVVLALVMAMTTILSHLPSPLAISNLLLQIPTTAFCISCVRLMKTSFGMDLLMSRSWEGS